LGYSLSGLPAGSAALLQQLALRPFFKLQIEDYSKNELPSTKTKSQPARLVPGLRENKIHRSTHWASHFDLSRSTWSSPDEWRKRRRFDL
jgi:hypothetical protein